MPTNKSAGPRGNRQSARAKSPERDKQHDGTTSASRDDPLMTAAVVGGVAAVGVFLWSRRNQISDQIGNLAEQISEWRDGTRSDSDGSGDPAREGSFASSGSPAGSRRTQLEIAEEALTLKETGATRNLPSS